MKTLKKSVTLIIAALLTITSGCAGVSEAVQSEKDVESTVATEAATETEPTETIITTESITTTETDTTTVTEKATTTTEKTVPAVTETTDTENIASATEESSENAENIVAGIDKEEILAETEAADSDIPPLFASDLNVTTLTDYSHVDTETLFLGNEEGATITVNAPAGTTADEIFVYGDEELLDISYESIDETQSCFTIYVKGKVEGNTELFIATTYELETMGEEAEGFILDICKLNSSEGQIAYVTPTGEKYHYSKECAGENATITTYKDCMSCGYEACKKCAS